MLAQLPRQAPPSIAELPEAGDVITGSISMLIEAVTEATMTGSPDRKAALTEVLAAAERIQAALRPKPRMN